MASFWMASAARDRRRPQKYWFQVFHAFQLLFDDRRAGSGGLRSRLCALSIDVVCSLIGCRPPPANSPSLRAKRSNPFFLCAARWIASSLRSLAQTLRVCLTLMGLNTTSHSRGARRPSFAGNLAPKNTEGAGKTGCALHPRSHVRCASKNAAHEHTGSAENTRPSLRNGFTAYTISSW